MKIKFFIFFLMLLSFSLFGKEQDCHLLDNTSVENLLKNFDDAFFKSKLLNGFYITSYNLKIEESCKERMPIKTLEGLFRNTMAEGALCLSKLSSMGPEGNKNIACFENLFEDKKNPPKILCGGWPFGKEISAVGSFPGSSKRHPYLWLGTEISKLYSTNPTELKATIFHEMLHNCGYIHSEGVEIPYTCEECCFNKSLSPDKKESACNICAGKYQDPNDSAYVKDLLHWSKDYPGWGRDMRSVALDIAIKNKNQKSLELLIDETNLDRSLKEEVVEILMQDNLDRLRSFIKSHEAKIKSDRIFQLLEKRSMPSK